MRYFPPPVDAFLGAENFVFRVRDVMATITLPTLEQALFGLFTITNSIVPAEVIGEYKHCQKSIPPGVLIAFTIICVRNSLPFPSRMQLGKYFSGGTCQMRTNAMMESVRNEKN
jgi:hypothetical protein